MSSGPTTDGNSARMVQIWLVSATNGVHPIPECKWPILVQFLYLGPLLQNETAHELRTFIATLSLQLYYSY